MGPYYFHSCARKELRVKDLRTVEAIPVWSSRTLIGEGAILELPHWVGENQTTRIVDVWVQYQSHADFQWIKSIVVLKFNGFHIMWLTKLQAFWDLMDVFNKVDLVVKLWLSGLIVTNKKSLYLCQKITPVRSRCSLFCCDLKLSPSSSLLSFVFLGCLCRLLFYCQGAWGPTSEVLLVCFVSWDRCPVIGQSNISKGGVLSCVKRWVPSCMAGAMTISFQQCLPSRMFTKPFFWFDSYLSHLIGENSVSFLWDF